MRNLFILTAAGAGAWIMVQAAFHLTASMVQSASAGPNPLTGLLIAPAVMVGALAGALLGGLLYPGC